MGYLATNFGQRIDFRIYTLEDVLPTHGFTCSGVSPKRCALPNRGFGQHALDPTSLLPRHSSVSNFRTIFTLDRVFSICTQLTLEVHFSLASGTFSRW